MPSHIVHIPGLGRSYLSSTDQRVIGRIISIDTQTLIWLFPIAFMLHDFEEIILGELWLRRNAGRIIRGITDRAPQFFVKQIGAVLQKSTSELSLTISLIFGLTILSSFLATEFNIYGPFLLASGIFFLHGFMHAGQAVLLRSYVPAVISSLVIAIPYGLILYPRLIDAGMIDLPGLLIYFFFSVLLAVPFILVMHKIGDKLHPIITRLLSY